MEFLRLLCEVREGSFNAPFPFTFGLGSCPFTTDSPPAPFTPFTRFSTSPEDMGGFPRVGAGGELFGKTNTFSSSSLLDLRRWIWTAVVAELPVPDIAESHCDEYVPADVIPTVPKRRWKGSKVQ